MSLTILGAHAGDVWIESSGDPVCLTGGDLASMRNHVRWFGTVDRAGATFDESDINELIKALTGPQLDDCSDCEGPGLTVIDGRPQCLGHAAGFAFAEAESQAS